MQDSPTEHTSLLSRQQSRDAEAAASDHWPVSKDDAAVGESAVGERLPYNDYTTIDWLHDLVKDSFRYRSLHAQKGIRGQVTAAWDACEGWVVAALIGVATAIVAFLVDISVVVVSDWKTGYCSTNFFAGREACCAPHGTSFRALQETGADTCLAWHRWATSFWPAFTIYVVLALVCGLISASVTLTTKSTLPSVDQTPTREPADGSLVPGKTMYMAAGSGIPEIKTILSGFVIPRFLELKVLVVKAVGSTFAVSTGMCLGKEGPFVHISTCAGWLVSNMFSRYRDNGGNMREMLSVACSAGLSVAFGAPIGGVLFSYEEISTYFRKQTLWKAFLCSLVAAITLKALNPTGTGKLVLFETNYGVPYDPFHYLVFILLGIAGGLFGGIFCQANFFWSRTFRKLSLIRDYPVFEVFLVVLATAVLQYPNPITREPGDVIIQSLLVDCKQPGTSWVCEREAQDDKSAYYGWLVYGAMVKLVLTIVTFGCKVPSGIIIPALDAGAFFGRLVGNGLPGISPGIFAMVGAGAFLAGVSRMTVSLAVIMFELTGEVDYIPPFMVAILVAKWVADAISHESVYDLAQTVLGHPFLDADHAVGIVKSRGGTVEELIPPARTMDQITVHLPPNFTVPLQVLREKLSQLRNRGLMDAGLVLVDAAGLLRGYLGEAELEYVLSEPLLLKDHEPVDFANGPVAAFVDHTPLTIYQSAPLEYAVEMFGRLGLRYLIVLDENSRVVGVIIKKRMVLHLEKLADGH